MAFHASGAQAVALYTFSPLLFPSSTFLGGLSGDILRWLIDLRASRLIRMISSPVCGASCGGAALVVCHFSLVVRRCLLTITLGKKTTLVRA